MASAEHTASLPPIIEDEGDENLLPMFYQKELERKDYHSQEKRSTTNNESNSELNSEPQPPLPYNSWKAKNRMLSRSVENGIHPDMVSRLGQSLENCHSIVPGRMQSGFQTINNPMYSPENIPHKTHNMITHQTEHAFKNQSNIELKKYAHVHQDVPKGTHIFDTNFMQNTDPRVYPGSVREYHGCTLNDNKSQFSPDRNSPFHVQPGSNNHYEHEDVSPTPFILNSPSNTQFGSIPFRSGFHSGNHRFEKICQKSCCQGNFTSQNTYLTSLMPPDRQHLNLGSSNFHENTISSPHNSVSKKTSNCHCNHGLEVKLKKKDKSAEKNKNKQISDLYRIVWLQNQQLIQLQNEVKTLIEYNVKNEERNQKISEQEHSTKKQSKSTMEKRMFNLHVIEENKNLMEKVSVGIMTSFIDTTSVKKRGKNKDLINKKEAQSNKLATSSESETSGSTETSSEEKEKRNEEIPKLMGNKKYKYRKSVEDSIILNGIDIPSFAENIPSPAGSVHIDMQDYGSSSTPDSSDSDSDENRPAPVSWTFYDKVVGKVNNMLNNSESESEESDNEIRNKTLEQLRKLGVSVEESPISKRVTFDEPAYVPLQQKTFVGESDTSMKMNALALKYLQEDKISEESPPKGLDKCTNGSANSTNLSLATLRYLEKYHLLPRVTSNPAEDKVEKPRKKKEKKRDERKTHKKKSKVYQQSGKILDITAIKQQPKLLPKTQ